MTPTSIRSVTGRPIERAVQPALVAPPQAVEHAIEERGRSGRCRCSGFSSLEAIIGDSVSAMTPETMTAPASVKANSRNSAPVRPDTKPIGA